MKLFLTANSERGKAITKSGNEYVAIEVKNEFRECIAEILFDSKNLCILSIRGDIELDQREFYEPKTARECGHFGGCKELTHDWRCPLKARKCEHYGCDNWVNDKESEYCDMH